MELNQVPHSMEAEQAVIASILVDPAQIVYMSERLQAEYFYNPINGYVFEALLDLHKKSSQIDFITIKEQLVSNETFDKIGGMDYLLDLSEDATIAINAHEYSKIVLEKYIIRETITRASNIVTKGYISLNSDELIQFAEKEIFDLSKLTRSEDFLDWNTLIDEAHQKIEDLILNGDTTIGLKTGFSNLDKLTNGLQGSDLIILAARPSVGKTAFALNLARNVAVSNKDKSVAIFSLEMGADQLLTRLLAAQSSVPIANIKTGQLTAEEHSLVKHGLEDLRKLSVHIDETPGIKINDLKSKCRKIKIEQGLDFVVIDYLQLITTSNPSIGRQQEVSEISRELKGLAKELQVPVVALSQLSRAVESRPDKKPMMSDIRESGAIEQDADIIMMLYRPEYYGSNIELAEGEEVVEGMTQLLVTKHRNGATGELDFKFMKEINKFAAMATNYDE